MTVIGIFDTSDGSSLSQECILDYGAEATTKVGAMVEDINEAIEFSLCGEDVATVVTHTESFGGFGDQVS